jgi:hypothetical protein
MGTYRCIRRPVTRAECSRSPRPCPWVTCRHHLVPHLLRQNGAPRTNVLAQYGDISEGELGALPFTCVLDWLEARGIVAERLALYSGAQDCRAIGDVLIISRETVRYILRQALDSVWRIDRDVGEFLTRAYVWSKLDGHHIVFDVGTAK